MPNKIFFRFKCIESEAKNTKSISITEFEWQFVYEKYEVSCIIAKIVSIIQSIQ